MERYEVGQILVCPDSKERTYIKKNEFQFFLARNDEDLKLLNSKDYDKMWEKSIKSIDLSVEKDVLCILPLRKYELDESIIAVKLAKMLEKQSFHQSYISYYAGKVNKTRSEFQKIKEEWKNRKDNLTNLEKTSLQLKYYRMKLDFLKAIDDSVKNKRELRKINMEIIELCKNEKGICPKAEKIMKETRRYLESC